MLIIIIGPVIARIDKNKMTDFLLFALSSKGGFSPFEFKLNDFVPKLQGHRKKLFEF